MSDNQKEATTESLASIYAKAAAAFPLYGISPTVSAPPSEPVSYDHQPLQLADIVRLRGQTQNMTIIAIHEANRVECAWFDVDGVHNDALFNPKTLVMVTL